MIEGPDSGTSQALTVESATQKLAGLLSESEDKPVIRETPAAKKEAPRQSQKEESDEPSDSSSDESADNAQLEGDEGDDPNADTSKPVKKYKLPKSGLEIEVDAEDADEMERGSLRQADYTRKTQATAEERKKLDAENAAVREERQKYAQYLTKLEQTINDITTEPDWGTLSQENPAEYAAQREAWDAHKKKMKAIAEERSATEKKAEEDAVREVQTRFREEQTRLVEAIPEWIDEKVAKEDKVKLREYAKSVGLTPEELNSIYDHRVILVMRKAMMFDDAEKAKAAARKKIEQVKDATPGPAANQRRQPVSEVQKARKRLAQTGRVADAASVMTQFLD